MILNRNHLGWYRLLLRRWSNNYKLAHNSCEITNKGYGKIKRNIKGNGNVIQIGEGAFLDKTIIHIRGNNNMIEIGNHCTIGKGCSIWI